MDDPVLLKCDVFDGECVVPDVSKGFDTFIFKRKGQAVKKTAILEGNAIYHV
jgi:hypothetical protein